MRAQRAALELVRSVSDNARRAAMPALRCAAFCSVMVMEMRSFLHPMGKSAQKPERIFVIIISAERRKSKALAGWVKYLHLTEKKRIKPYRFVRNAVEEIHDVWYHGNRRAGMSGRPRELIFCIRERGK